MIGRTVSRYRILAKLGEGAMGEVYKAEHVHLHHPVAIKFLKHELLQGEDARARFHHEAEIAASVESPSLCAVIDFGEVRGRTYLVMRYCEGPSLQDLIAGGPLAIDRAVLFAIQMAEGLEAAHRRGIVHRDIKPGNVIVGRVEGCGCVKEADPNASTTEMDRATMLGWKSGEVHEQARIIDFGLALLPELSRVTGTDNMVGTPAYMAPEQVTGDPVDHRVDIWALGTVLYEMVTGRAAFAGDTAPAVLDAIRRRDPPSLSSLCPRAPAKLAWIVSKALRKRPSDRYIDATEMLGDLRSLHQDLRHGGGTSRPTWIVENVRWVRWAGLGLVAVALSVLGLREHVFQGDRSPPIPTGRAVPVTRGVAWEGEPDLSPDGSRIAYVSDENGQLDIYVIDARGGPSVRVTESPARDHSPAWFPNGSDLAYVSDRLGVDAIWKTGQHGGGGTLLLENAWDPAVSPDGTRLAYVAKADREEGRIGVVSLDDPSQRRLLTAGHEQGLWNHREPAWSRDGRRICYSAKNNLWLLDPETREVRQLTFDGREDRSPAWSHDDGHVYFASLRDDVYAVWRVCVDDGRVERLTVGGSNERHPSLSRAGDRLAFQVSFTLGEDMVLLDQRTGREVRLTGQYSDVFPALSQDGSLLAFVSDRWGDQDEIWLQELDAGAPNGRPRRLTEHVGHASHPAISPDKRWVAYYLFDGDERDIWVVPTAGGSPQRITDDPASDVHPAWSPDCSQLAFASDRGGGFGLWTVPVSEGCRAGPPRRLAVSDQAAYPPTWSPDGKRLAFRADGEIWIANLSTDQPPQRLTRGAQADRLRWDPGSNLIWISGRWGKSCFNLRTVSPAGGEPQLVVPEHCVNDLTNPLMFDITRNGDLLAINESVSRSRIWVLEATGGMF